MLILAYQICLGLKPANETLSNPNDNHNKVFPSVKYDIII